mmetsp:Transcript_140845/g.351132  ORF Transcript_140845/g.351132 Transcript_140845/m.351132 type:complete len:239 (+) Transcript_140845:1611-2327(+)
MPNLILFAGLLRVEGRIEAADDLPLLASVARRQPQVDACQSAESSGYGLRLGAPGLGAEGLQCEAEARHLAPRRVEARAAAVDAAAAAVGARPVLLGVHRALELLEDRSCGTCEPPQLFGCGRRHEGSLGEETEGEGTPGLGGADHANTQALNPLCHGNCATGGQVQCVEEAAPERLGCRGKCLLEGGRVEYTEARLAGEGPPRCSELQHKRAVLDACLAHQDPHLLGTVRGSPASAG